MGVHFHSQFRNPLAYPAGYAPGFDPNHICGQRVRFSGVAIPGNFLNLLTGMKGTLVGTPTQQLRSYGPEMVCPSGTIAASFPGSTVNDAECTIGVLAFVGYTTGSNRSWFSSSASNSGWRFRQSNGDNPVITAGAVADNGGQTINKSTFYFIAASCNASQANFVIKDLTTGKLTTVSQSGIGSTAAPDGTYLVGNNTFGQPQTEGLMAVMFSAQSHSLWDLVQWSNDPWSFWYPNPGDNWIAAAATSGLFKITGNPRSLAGFGGGLAA